MGKKLVGRIKKFKKDKQGKHMNNSKLGSFAI